MNAIIAAVVAVWLIKGLLDAIKGGFQIALGVFCGIVGLVLFTLALVLDGLGHLWATAFPGQVSEPSARRQISNEHFRCP